MNPRVLGLVIALLAIAGAIYYFERGRVHPGIGESEEVRLPTVSREEKESRYTRAKEISTPDGFVNTKGTTIGEFIGKKVVLVDFWTYSCINCQRTLPYLRRWHDLYADKGLEIIGIHTPEFEFEKKYENVEKAVRQFGIPYSVVLDNDFSTGYAYGMRFWPEKYLIDIDGYVVYKHIGEGAYTETEKVIQTLLEERSRVLGEKFETPVAAEREKLSDDVNSNSRNQSPETYFGASRNVRLGNGTPLVAGAQSFSDPISIEPDTLYLTGAWNIENEYAESLGPGVITFRYSSKRVFLVAGAGDAKQIAIFRDGIALTDAVAGQDVKRGGSEIREPRLYDLIEEDAFGTHTLTIQVPSGVKAFTFTFGS